MADETNPRSLAEFPALLEPNSRIYVAGSSGEPTELLTALAAAKHIPESLHFIQFPLPGLNRMDFTALSETTEQTLFFMTPDQRSADPNRTHFVPIHMRRVIDFLMARPPDVALLQVCRGLDGQLRIAANVDFAQAVCTHPATRVIALLNTTLPAPAGAPLLDPARVSDFVSAGAAGGAVPTLPSAQIDATAAQIGALVAGLIRDGDCLQTGIGAIPAAVLGALGDKRQLGLHGGLIDDAMLQLIEAGVVTGERKSIDPKAHVAGMVLGNHATFQTLARRPDVLLRGAEYTHEVGVISQIDQFVSINSAVQVDLLGQVNGEFAAGRQLSGTGGSVDFMRAARSSRGGRSIVALPATARGGSVSRIVTQVEMVTAARTDTDFVVTEYGIAELRDRSLVERGRALAAIAAPAFQAELLAGLG